MTMHRHIWAAHRVRCLLAALAMGGLLFAVPAEAEQAGAAQVGAHAVFRLTPSEARAVLARNFYSRADEQTPQLQAVVVSQQIDRLPMESPTRDIWRGLGAPFWALLHPAQSWRIFFPILPP